MANVIQTPGRRAIAEAADARAAVLVRGRASASALICVHYPMARDQAAPRVVPQRGASTGTVFADRGPFHALRQNAEHFSSSHA
jgi:hypothetical protein